MTISLLQRESVARCLLVTLFASAPQLGAQTVARIRSGIELRYSGDTLWHERDTTVTRTVYRGDTITRVIYVNGKVASVATYVGGADSWKLTDYRDGAGKTLPMQFERDLSTSSLEFDQHFLERAVDLAAGEARIAEQMARLQKAAADMGRTLTPMPPRPTDAPPQRPADIRRYGVSANTMIVQHVDTIRIVHGCAAIRKADTTTYVVLGADSVRRLAPSPRTFDHHMVDALFADMSSAMLAANVEGRALKLVPDLPGPRRWPCDIR